MLPMNLTVEGPNITSDLVQNNPYSWKLVVFVSVFSSLYTALGLFNFSNFIRYRRRIWKRKDILVIIVYVEMTVICFTASLIFIIFVHPYSDFVFGMSVPFLVNSFCLIQIIFLRLTRLDIKPIQYNGMKCVLLSTCFMILTFTFCQICNSTNVFHVNILLFNNLSFIGYSIYLSVCFIISAPKLAKYTKQLQNAKNDISFQSLSKRRDSSKDANGGRYNAPRIRHFGNLVRLVSDSESSECHTEQTKASAPEIKLFLSTTRRLSRNSTSNSKDLPKFSKFQRKSITDSSIEMYNGMFCITSQNESPACVLPKKDHRSMSFPRENTQEHSIKYKIPRSCCNLNRPDFLAVDRSSLSDSRSYNSSSSSFRCDNWWNSTNRISHRKGMESGYFADNEIISVNSELSQLSDTRHGPQSPYSTKIPNSLSFLSFYRIQQGKLLKMLLLIIYIFTALLGISSFVKLYNIYRNFRKAKQIDTDSSDWWVYHTIQRLIDLGLVILTSAAVSVVVQHKTHRRRRFVKSRTADHGAFSVH